MIRKYSLSLIGACSSLFLLSFLISCESITQAKQDRLIARADNHYLYWSDIERELPPFSSEQDSLSKVNFLINEWARQKLIYEKALINLDADKISVLNAMVNDYKTNLFKNAYRELILKSSQDSLYTGTLVNDYYMKNLNSFKLKESIYRIRYIGLPLDNVDQKEIKRRFKSFNREDIDYLDSLSFQFSNYFLLDSVWFKESEIRNRLDFLNERQQNRFIKTPNYYEVKDSLVLYLLSLVEQLDPGNIAPLPYVEQTIKDLVSNKRKIEFLRSFDNDILQDAIKTKKFEKY
ncbi:MAG: hypothetical protein O2878_06085 [Bacteroidetes bacterium]|nr:hypothetical protein [Bacteroidota bacterium]MDA0936678.1 hypothetical protein [Bacteroidota bacterium]